MPLVSVAQAGPMPNVVGEDEEQSPERPLALQVYVSASFSEQPLLNASQVRVSPHCRTVSQP